MVDFPWFDMPPQIPLKSTIYKATRPQSYKAARLQGYSLQGYKALIYRLQGYKAARL